MNAEKQLYIEADKYLRALARLENYQKLDENLPTNEQREAIHAILEKEGAAQYMSGIGFHITTYGKAIVYEGGLYKKYKQRNRNERFTNVGIISSIIAAITGIITVVIALI